MTQKQDFTSKIISNHMLTDNFYEMELEAKGITFNAGEFFQISVPGHTLRRPFAPSFSDSTSFRFTYQLVGEGTVDMSKLRPGTELQVIAPLGHGFTLPPKNSTAILIGGGCGTPSLALLASRLQAESITTYAVIGARSSCSVLEREALNRYCSTLIITTDDGSEGLHGNSVDGLKTLLSDINTTDTEIRLFACGPIPMLKGLSTVAQAKGIKAELSFEERMACGFGACMGCVIKIVCTENTEGYIYKRVCQDGPVFDSKEIYW